ncbi:toxin-antitoxin system YwqK family antitoxin [Flavobacterium humi]|uniref:Toxin-antitoxin system YwqK family antitoxin n=1 Tax=Flavobacterium humi TaxID=2562683 RepID=A0A4Z0L6Q3_9FLAO|nr:hypothetical protein [Flavobacterium humi]TGD56854.1 hypothetical protein E4635_13725 [Flavobacterium humi]
MKTKALSSILYSLTALLLVSFSDPYSIKRISDTNFRYEFYTTDKKIKPRNDKTYYWFKGGLIHNAQGGQAGELLNDKFVKMYHSNQLAEQGIFKNGLKNGLWKTWHANGTLETIQKWKSGLRTGKFYHYDQNGMVTEEGNFKNNKKHGIWIDYVTKDTTAYKRGELYVIEPKVSKKERKENKERNSITKEEKRASAISKKTERQERKSQMKKTEATEYPSQENHQKKGFFSRIFGKKQPNQNTING